MSTLLQRGGRLGFATMALATILWAGTASTATAHGGGGGGGGGGHGGGMGGGHMGGMGYGHMGGMGYGHMGGMGYGHHPGYGYGRHYGYGGLGYGGYYPGFFGMGLYGLGFGGYGLGYGLGYGGYGLGYGGLGYGGYGGSGYPYYGGLGYPYDTGYGYGYGYPASSGGYTSEMPLTTYSSAYVAPGGGTANTAAGQPRILGVDEEPVVVGNGQKGMKIMNVYPGTAAQAAGLKAGDVLLSANGYLTEQHGNLAWIIANATPSNQLKLNVLTAADNQQHTVTATIP